MARWQSDLYFKFLMQGVAGFCPEANLDPMEIGISNLPESGAIIEIGSMLGRSASYLSRFMEMYQKKALFCSVDDWYFEGYWPNGMIKEGFSSDDWRAFTEKSFKINMEHLAHPRPNHFKMRSAEFLKAWDQGAELTDLWDLSVKLGGPIGFAFIDGDHHYQPSKTDFEGIDKHLLSGGHILFDDSAADAPFECVKLAVEVSERPDYVLVGRYPNILVRKK
jgi:hypothetical protein